MIYGGLKDFITGFIDCNVIVKESLPSDASTATVMMRNATKP